jgi:hypothetical protein
MLFRQQFQKLRAMVLVGDPGFSENDLHVEIAHSAARLQLKATSGVLRVPFSGSNSTIKASTRGWCETVNIF